MQIEDQLYLLRMHFAPGGPSLAAVTLQLRNEEAPKRGDRAARDLEFGVKQDLAWLSLPGRFLLSYLDPDYPSLLAAIADPPPLLFCRGDRDCLRTPAIAIVGSRNATSTGRDTAFAFAAQLAAAGFAVASGMASGIDAAGHRGALSAGGATIAVLGTGPDRVYPARHTGLAEAIAANGLLLSEYPVGTPGYPANFPRRNRVVTGLCLGTVVVEATLGSGSLVSARHAMNQGRDVFAVPGSIRQRQSQGCHRLIRDGACLTESIADILAELGPVPGLKPGRGVVAPLERDLPPARFRDVTRYLEHNWLPFDEILRRARFDASTLAGRLLEMEVEGWVVSEFGNYRLR